VQPGEQVVLLGAQGDKRVTPDMWAGLLGTISHEVVRARLAALLGRRARAASEWLLPHGWWVPSTQRRPSMRWLWLCCGRGRPP